MYITKEGKIYKQSLVEISQDEIVEMLNKGIEEKVTKKLELEETNLGKPTNLQIEINPKKASETIPQAWENNGEWYYNFEGALLEAETLGKKIPTREEWGKIVKDFGVDGEKLSQELKLPYAGSRNWYSGTWYYGGSYGYYWSSAPDGAGGYSLGFYSSYINPSYHGNRAHGFSVRCLKN